MCKRKMHPAMGLLAAAVLAGAGGCGSSLGDDSGETDRRSGAQQADRTGSTGAREPAGGETGDSAAGSDTDFTRPSLGPRYIGGERTAPTYDPPGPDDAQSGYTPDALRNRGHVIAPWTRVVADAVAERATVEDGRLIFAEDDADAFGDLQRFDILVAGSKSQPFSRRVLHSRRDAAGRLVVRTRPAKLNESILQGSLRSGGAPKDAPSSNEDSPYRSRTHALRNGKPDYESLGRFDATGLGLGGVTDLLPPLGVYKDIGASFNVDISGRPTASLEPKYFFNLDIDFDAGDKAPKGFSFYSTRTCQTDADCFDGGLAGGEECDPYFPSIHNVRPEVANHLTPYDANNQVKYCTYDPPPGGQQVQVREPNGEQDGKDEYRKCERILKTLEWVKEDGDGHQCGKDWETWYHSKGHRGARNPESCQGWFWDAFAPYPAQLEWAKLVCHGTLKQMELDFRTDLTAGIEDFQMSASGGGFKAWAPVDMDPKTLASPMFWVGWVPVVLTFNFDFSMPIVASLSGDVGFNDAGPAFIGVKNATIPGGGLHMYANEDAYKDGHFGPPKSQRPSGYLGDLHVNDVPEQSTTVHTPNVSGNLRGGVSVSLMPELNLLLYDMVGPYVRPIVPYAEFFGAVGSDKICNLGAKVGAKGQIGLKAQLPFGLGQTQKQSAKSKASSSGKSKLRSLLGFSPFASWTLYNTCSAKQSFVEKTLLGQQADADPEAMCRKGVEQLCVRTCLVGDCEEPPEEDPDGGMADTGMPGPDVGPDTGVPRPDTGTAAPAPDTAAAQPDTGPAAPTPDPGGQNTAGATSSGGCSTTGRHPPFLSVYWRRWAWRPHWVGAAVGARKESRAHRRWQIPSTSIPHC